jgi:hypothetical protein
MFFAAAAGLLMLGGGTARARRYTGNASPARGNPQVTRHHQVERTGDGSECAMVRHLGPPALEGARL